MGRLEQWGSVLDQHLNGVTAAVAGRDEAEQLVRESMMRVRYAQQPLSPKQLIEMALLEPSENDVREMSLFLKDMVAKVADDTIGEDFFDALAHKALGHTLQQTLRACTHFVHAREPEHFAALRAAPALLRRVNQVFGEIVDDAVGAVVDKITQAWDDQVERHVNPRVLDDVPRDGWRIDEAALPAHVDCIKFPRLLVTGEKRLGTDKRHSFGDDVLTMEDLPESRVFDTFALCVALYFRNLVLDQQKLLIDTVVAEFTETILSLEQRLLAGAFPPQTADGRVASDIDQLERYGLDEQMRAAAALVAALEAVVNEIDGAGSALRAAEPIYAAHLEQVARKHDEAEAAGGGSDAEPSAAE